MKIRNLPLLISLAALGATNSAFALTAANVDIDNTATISYSVGASAQTAIESSPTGNTTPGVGNGAVTTFKVDRVIDLSVTKGSDENVVPNGTGGAVTAKTTIFTLNNEGNSQELFDITLNPALAGDNFDTSNCSITSIGAAQGGATATTAGLTVTLSQETHADVTVTCDIPNTDSIPLAAGEVYNGKTSDVEFKATANRAQTNGNADDAATVQTVYGDDAAAGTSDGGAKNGSHAAINTYVIQTADLSVQKTSEVVCDPYNDTTKPKRIPGAVVKYTITVTNSAAAGASASGVVINDPIPTNMSYIATAPAGCSAAIVGSATTNGGSTNAVTLTDNDTGGATVTSKTIAMPVDSSAKLVFFAEVQ